MIQRDAQENELQRYPKISILEDRNIRCRTYRSLMLIFKMPQNIRQAQKEIIHNLNELSARQENKDFRSNLTSNRSPDRVQLRERHACMKNVLKSRLSSVESLN